MLNVTAILNDGRCISTQADTEEQGIDELRRWASSSWYTRNGGLWFVRGFIADGRGLWIHEFDFVGAVPVKK